MKTYRSWIQGEACLHNNMHGPRPNGRKTFRRQGAAAVVSDFWTDAEFVHKTNIPRSSWLILSHSNELCESFLSFCLVSPQIWIGCVWNLRHRNEIRTTGWIDRGPFKPPVSFSQILISLGSEWNSSGKGYSTVLIGIAIKQLRVFADKNFSHHREWWRLGGQNFFFVLQRAVPRWKIWS